MWSHPETIVRVLLAILGFAGALFAPWPFPVLCMILLSLRFAAWEVPLIGFFIDMMWLPGNHFMIPYFMIFGIALVWLASPVRRQLLL